MEEVKGDVCDTTMEEEAPTRPAPGTTIISIEDHRPGGDGTSNQIAQKLKFTLDIPEEPTSPDDVEGIDYIRPIVDPETGAKYLPGASKLVMKTLREKLGLPGDVTMDSNAELLERFRALMREEVMQKRSIKDPLTGKVRMPDMQSMSDRELLKEQRGVDTRFDEQASQRMEDELQRMYEETMKDTKKQAMDQKLHEEMESEGMSITADRGTRVTLEEVREEYVTKRIPVISVKHDELPYKLAPYLPVDEMTIRSTMNSYWNIFQMILLSSCHLETMVETPAMLSLLTDKTWPGVINSVNLLRLFYCIDRITSSGFNFDKGEALAEEDAFSTGWVLPVEEGMPELGNLALESGPADSEEEIPKGRVSSSLRAPPSEDDQEESGDDQEIEQITDDFEGVSINRQGDLTLRGPRRIGDEGMQVNDILVWVPYNKFTVPEETIFEHWRLSLPPWLMAYKEGVVETESVKNLFMKVLRVSWLRKIVHNKDLVFGEDLISLTSNWIMFRVRHNVGELQDELIHDLEHMVDTQPGGRPPTGVGDKIIGAADFFDQFVPGGKAETHVKNAVRNYFYATTRSVPPPHPMETRPDKAIVDAVIGGIETYLLNEEYKELQIDQQYLRANVVPGYKDVLIFLMKTMASLSEDDAVCLVGNSDISILSLEDCAAINVEWAWIWKQRTLLQEQKHLNEKIYAEEQMSCLVYAEELAATAMAGMYSYASKDAKGIFPEETENAEMRKYMGGDFVLDTLSWVSRQRVTDEFLSNSTKIERTYVVDEHLTTECFHVSCTCLSEEENHVYRIKMTFPKCIPDVAIHSKAPQPNYVYTYNLDLSRYPMFLHDLYLILEKSLMSTISVWTLYYTMKFAHAIPIQERREFVFVPNSTNPMMNHKMKEETTFSDLCHLHFERSKNTVSRLFSVNLEHLIDESLYHPDLLVDTVYMGEIVQLLADLKKAQKGKGRFKDRDIAPANTLPDVEELQTRMVIDPGAALFNEESYPPGYEVANHYRYLKHIQLGEEGERERLQKLEAILTAHKHLIEKGATIYKQAKEEGTVQQDHVAPSEALKAMNADLEETAEEDEEDEEELTPTLMHFIRKKGYIKPVDPVEQLDCVGDEQSFSFTRKVANSRKGAPRKIGKNARKKVARGKRDDEDVTKMRKVTEDLQALSESLHLDGEPPLLEPVSAEEEEEEEEYEEDMSIHHAPVLPQ